MQAMSYDLLEKLFLSGYPLNKWCWPDIVEFLLKDSEDELQNQRLVLKSTVNHYLAQKCPLKISYQLMFLKMLISKLEENNMDVCDEFYEAYCQRLGKNESLEGNEIERHYRHFPLNNTYISLRESTKLVSEGTTGLHAWQASMALAEWCLKNKETCLKSKNILELGSGVGLTGLACILGTSNPIKELLQECGPSKENVQVETCSKDSRLLNSPMCYTFSDCHPSVLQLLCQNVKQNLLEENDLRKELEESKDEVNGSVFLETDFHGTGVRVIYLPWEDLKEGSEEVLGAVREVDIVIAADVVYDQSLFPPLVGSLKKLLTMTNGNGKFPSAIIACTKRDPETIKEFLDCLSASGLKAVEEDAVQPQNFLYEPNPPVCIYNVTS